MGTVTEIAVRRVKDGKAKVFSERRRSFIELLQRQRGVLVDREFESFYSLPEPDSDQVFVGMTTYEGLSAQARIQRNLRVIWRFLRFSRTMRLKAYLYVDNKSDPSFDLAKLADVPGQVLELAIRRVKPDMEDEFEERREAFVSQLDSRDGVVRSHELKVVKGRDIDNVTVGMTVYESRQVFEEVSQALMAEQLTKDYFETFDPVAIQYLTSAKVL